MTLKVFNVYLANIAKYLETPHEKLTIKIVVFITISIKTTFERNLNFRRIRASIDTNINFAYDYVAIENAYLDIKLSNNKM